MTGEDVLASLGIASTDLSQQRQLLAEAGQVLTQARLTHHSQDGQVQATVDGNGTLLRLEIAERQRGPGDADTLNTAILEAVRGARVQAAAVTQEQVTAALAAPAASPITNETLPVPHALAEHEHHHHAPPPAEDETSFEEIDFLDTDPDEERAW
ncbi:hypothetical protein GCM10010174_88840 [Kutzneria viridogrisea]